MRGVMSRRRAAKVGLRGDEGRPRLPERHAGFVDERVSVQRRSTCTRPRGPASLRYSALRVSVASDAFLSSVETDTRSGSGGCLSSF